jgi:hypothetical protein
MIMVIVKSLPLPPGQKLTDKEIEEMVKEVGRRSRVHEVL